MPYPASLILQKQRRDQTARVCFESFQCVYLLVTSRGCICRAECGERCLEQRGHRVILTQNNERLRAEGTLPAPTECYYKKLLQLDFTTSKRLFETKINNNSKNYLWESDFQGFTS